jgi:hypothetical protein
VSRSPWNGDPNLEWVLGTDFVKGESGKKADHALRRAAGDLSETVVCRDGRVRKAIQPSTNSLQLSGAAQSKQVFSWNPDVFDIARADDWELPGERQNAI